jgi:hypothetical protein
MRNINTEHNPKDRAILEQTFYTFISVGYAFYTSYEGTKKGGVEG